MTAPVAVEVEPERPTCVECGNDAATEGYRVCTDCLEEFFADTDPPEEYLER